MKKIKYRYYVIVSFTIITLLVLVILTWLKLIRLPFIEYTFSPIQFLLILFVLFAYTISTTVIFAIKKKYKAISINFLLLIILVVLAIVMPSTIFAEHHYNTIVKTFSLVNYRKGSQVPAGYSFPIDSDGSIETNSLKEYYGDRYVRRVIGEFYNTNTLTNEKILILYLRDSYFPENKLTILKLENSFEVDELEYNQGYEKDEFPIVEIVSSPFK